MLGVFAISLLVGILTEFVDLAEEHGLKTPKKVSYATGAIYGILLAYAASYFALSSLVIGVMLGLIFTKKIDGYGHYFGLITFAIFTILLGIPEFSIYLFFLFFAASMLDELLHKADFKRVKVLSKRPMLEITSFAFSALTGLWIFWVAILAYDLGAYVMMKKIVYRKQRR